MNTAVAIPPTAELNSGEFQLTPDQQAALDAFHLFLMDPNEVAFVLQGYSGCGKSTLVRTLLDRLPGYVKTAKLINPSYKELLVELTATTNKAAESLHGLTGMPVSTIHSFLGLRVSTDFKTQVTTLIPRSLEPKQGYLIFTDEASFIDSPMLELIFKLIKNSKIVFIGDPAQLTPVKSSGTPVFNAKFPGAKLTQVVRQAEGNPIVDLSTMFRNTVNTGTWTPFTPDGHHIQHMDRDAFNKAIELEFTRPDWRYKDSKILGWTNKCVIGFNHMVRNLAKGDPHFQEGDYAICNQYLQGGRNYSIKTDQLVQITELSQEYEEYGVLGRMVEMDNVIRAFHPSSLEAKKTRINVARKRDELSIAAEMETRWVDLRAAYAQTVNKAQGSTYDRVFIDLDDIARCNSGDQIARMLYVAASRARFQVFLTGDLA